MSSDGHATDLNEPIVPLSFELDTAYALDDVILYNDFGASDGQGVRVIEGTLKDGTGAA